MARLEYIHHESTDASLNERGELTWAKSTRKPIERLPQIFWEDGRGWDEVNLWALDSAESHQLHPDTTKRTMKHLSRYAAFLEQHSLDWRSFPVRKEDQVLRRFRKHLIDEVKRGMLAGSTASNRMNAVVRFYRFADAHDLVGAHQSMWVDRVAIIPYFDTAGFKRSMVRLTNDLKIPNQKRIGSLLEDGLLPLRAEHMTELLAYTARHAIEELHRMLAAGFFTGARIGTITTLTVTSLETAREDPLTPGLNLIRVGPPTGVATKFSVAGELLVPEAVFVDLKTYASSSKRLLREAKAHQRHKKLLFLNRKGAPYTVETVNRLVHEMRKRATSAGLQFMQRFTFHQSRATFGTWLMQILLDSGSKTDAIRLVRDAMLHKNEKTTLGYIRFIEDTHAKGQFAAAFNEAFTGLRNRNWDDSDE